MTRELIGLVLFLLIAALYFLYSWQRVNPDQTVRVRGRLAVDPFHGIQGGDFKYHFVRLKLIGRSEEFKVEECSYDRLNYARLNQLKSGDFVETLRRGWQKVIKAALKNRIMRQLSFWQTCFE